MEHADENYKAIDPNVLNKFRQKIQAVEDIEQVYLSEAIREGTVITILVKQESPVLSQKISYLMENLLENLPKLRFRIYNFAYAKQELEKGNLYFIKNCILGELISKGSTLEKLNLRNREELETLIEKAAFELENEIERINSFTVGISFYWKRKEWAGAAFLIHQKIEWLYRCVETFAMGKPLICHKIKNHLNYAHPFIHGAGPLFDTNRRINIQLLDILDRAYIESRYSSGYDITKKEVKILSKRAEIMEQQVREIFSFRLKECYELLEKEKLSAEIPLEQPKIHKPAESPTEKTDQTKEHFLAEKLLNNLVMLKPHDTYKGKYKVDLLYVEGYGELLFTIRSLLYLCINSLEYGDFKTYSPDRNPKSNIQDVLELVSRLIPIEEGDLLDELREIVQSRS
ncbi:hypothetical protein LZ575_17530 [Antarcticibacterium sp. 1MA-6-2]|uniref:hypothetical protein n=1 Tax=Antarcticibacterium sp. 1MA-6-2 TaxID=2908210 RepID=UPI001F2BE339|nr:hypothetical protein [Antarcticibacterium sp. 1MA-6-2]UJH90567.1 hypothetical protein LZ575_17530 [Antarcticibacterium sp. 1MA-6-2]